jgi:HAMP domain-containing protein
MISDRKQQHERRAVRDAQNLVAFTAKSGISVDDNTLKTLITAAEKWDTEEWTPEFALEFWKAFGVISQLIKPATVDSVSAICDEPREPGFWGFLKNLVGRNPARRTTNAYTFFTLAVLLVLLFFQIYWVVGRGLENRLSELLNNEVELTTSINNLQQDLDEVELRFKITEAESTSLSGDRSYNFYYTPDWERETLHMNDEINRLEGELEFIRVQLDRNNDILLIWAVFWSSLIVEEKDNPELLAQIDDHKQQIETKSKLISEDPEGLEEIKGIQIKLDDLNAELGNLAEDADLDLRAQIQKDIAEFEQRLANPDLSQQIINQRKTDLDDLNSKLASLERQDEGEKTKEKSRRARLLAVFLLDILQSYILPLLYGLLGASAYILRSSAKEIENVTYSVQSNRGYLLRLALGTLAGLIVGWFIFLLPGQTFLASISPFALAFLVGYNIEIIFSWMDNFINRVQKRSSETDPSKTKEPEPPAEEQPE